MTDLSFQRPRNHAWIPAWVMEAFWLLAIFVGTLAVGVIVAAVVDLWWRL
jgi:hypothetical protein